MSAGNNNRLRLTRQRMAVLDAVRSQHTHVDASTVFDLVRRKIPKISLGTVYRALSSLREANLIYEIDTGVGPALYDGNLTPHNHISCRACGRVVDISVKIPAAVVEQAAAESGFAEVQPSFVDFHGLCASCAEPQEDPDSTSLPCPCTTD